MNTNDQPPDNPLLDMVRTFQTARSEWAKVAGKFADIWLKNREQVASALRNFAENVARFPEHIEVTGRLLAARGWYLDNEFAAVHVRAARELMEAGRANEVDEFMIEYFSKSVDRIEFELLAAYPSRSSVLKAAFDALRNDQPALAIPVLLAQSDGICLDLLGAKLFQKAGRRPQVAQRIEALELDDASGMMLSVLKLPGGVAASADFRSLYPECLNRHEILHGLDSQYGTCANGWKALSLLAFVGLLVPRVLSEASAARDA